ncbi:MAG: (2Fe-2S)-binding protein [Dysgonamonadaceae bacterium]|jgi:uncharacterized C2H2 Zn-finger protein|nr:(2Fe-2S)-binding protein [Dysgonamonadaceae bacterium]
MKNFNPVKIIVLTFLFCIFSCEDEYVSPIPYREVNLTLELNFRDKELQSQIFATKIFTTPRDESDRLGYGGLLVINGTGSNGATNIYAYDLACPNEANPTVRVQPITPDSTYYARCPKCGAIFDISAGYGNPVSGSQHYLKSYRITKISSVEYRVTN